MNSYISASQYHLSPLQESNTGCRLKLSNTVAALIGVSPQAQAAMGVITAGVPAPVEIAYIDLPQVMLHLPYWVRSLTWIPHPHHKLLNQAVSKGEGIIPPFLPQQGRDIWRRHFYISTNTEVSCLPLFSA